MPDANVVLREHVLSSKRHQDSGSLTLFRCARDKEARARLRIGGAARILNGDGGFADFVNQVMVVVFLAFWSLQGP